MDGKELGLDGTGGRVEFSRMSVTTWRGAGAVNEFEGMSLPERSFANDGLILGNLGAPLVTIRGSEESELELEGSEVDRTGSNVGEMDGDRGSNSEKGGSQAVSASEGVSPSEDTIV